MNTKIPYIALAKEASSDDEGGYVKGVVTYMVMDDLVMKPMSTISSIALLEKFSVKEVGALEERVVDLGMDEVYIYICYLFCFSLSYKPYFVHFDFSY